MFTNFLEYFGTFTAFAGGAVVVTQMANNIFHVENKTAKKIISWIVSILLALVGFICQLGFFTEYGTINMWQGWLMTVLTGLGAGLYANGIYGIDSIKEFIHWVFKFLETDNKQTSDDEQL